MDWYWHSFNELSTDQLLDALIARQQVFVLEQQCIYLDADQLDRGAWHLLGYQGELLCAYARAHPPGQRFAEASFGRVLTIAERRGQGLGKQLVSRLLVECRRAWPKQVLLISAQSYLRPFYAAFGFQCEGEVFAEDGIEHIQMRLVSG